MDTVKKVITALPAPPPGRSPGLACVIGLLFGGIGLGIYLRNVVDLVMPLALFVVAVSQFGDIGYMRVHLAATCNPVAGTSRR